MTGSHLWYANGLCFYGLFLCGFDKTCLWSMIILMRDNDLITEPLESDQVAAIVDCTVES